MGEMKQKSIDLENEVRALTARVHSLEQESVLTNDRFRRVWESIGLLTDSVKIISKFFDKVAGK